jgi:3-methyladenine DNA glycosylase AlkD
MAARTSFLVRQPASSVVRQRASDVVRQLQRLADPERAGGLQQFFRTAPGEYGAGDLFLGLSMPQIRGLAKELGDLPLGEIEKLLESQWHESRVLALVLLTNAYRRSDAAGQTKIYRLYLRRTDRVNNWDLVDVSAPGIVGAHLFGRSRTPLFRLARSKDLWERRIAIVATQHFIQRRDFADTLRLAQILMPDKHDLIHKAVGWMLREVGKRDERVLTRFLDRYAGALPRTTLRYSIERLSPTQRKRYMAAPSLARRARSA